MSNSCLYQRPSSSSTHHGVATASNWHRPGKLSWKSSRTQRRLSWAKSTALSRKASVRSLKSKGEPNNQSHHSNTSTLPQAYPSHCRSFCRYPTIKYGDPKNLKDYEGERELADLQKFAKVLPLNHFYFKSSYHGWRLDSEYIY